MDDDTTAINNGSGADKSAPDPMIGYLLDGRYELLKAIGSGGMSIVYQARLNNVGKMVAIKTLNIQVQAKDNVRERFYREIDLLLKLEHPHIVAVQDCLLGPNNQPYLVMDLLRGVTLEQELADHGPLPADRVRKIMIQTCAAVKFAHQHSVVHRDLKPGNIMLLENEVDFVKVLDFGLALIGENNHKITQSGEFWGSPPYASPEQVKGDEMDHRSDIYSLGCVMYELLSGRDPFSGAGLFELLHKHVNEMPQPISVTTPGVIVPPALERIVFKCLEKRPADRFQSVAELQNALETLNSGSNAVHDQSSKPYSSQSEISSTDLAALPATPSAKPNSTPPIPPSIKHATPRSPATISSLRREEIQQFHLPKSERSFKAPLIVVICLGLCVGFIATFMAIHKTPKADAAKVNRDSAPVEVSPSVTAEQEKRAPEQAVSPQSISSPSSPQRPPHPQAMQTHHTPAVESEIKPHHQHPKVEPIAHAAKPAHLRPETPSHNLKHEAKPANPVAGDPFARLRKHLSTGANDD